MTHLLNIAVFPWFIYEFTNGYKHRKNKPCSEHYEDAPNILHPESAGFFAVLLGAAVASPPLFLHHVQLSLLLQLEDGDGDLVSVRRPCKVRTRPVSAGCSKAKAGREQATAIRSKSAPLSQDWLFQLESLGFSSAGRGKRTDWLLVSALGTGKQKAPSVWLFVWEFIIISRVSYWGLFKPWQWVSLLSNSSISCLNIALSILWDFPLCISSIYFNICLFFLLHVKWVAA